MHYRYLLFIGISLLAVVRTIGIERASKDPSICNNVVVTLHRRPRSDKPYSFTHIISFSPHKNSAYSVYLNFTHDITEA